MTRMRLSVAAASVVAAAAVGGLGAWAWSAGDPGGSDEDAGRAVPVAVVQTEFPGLAAPTGEPELPGIDAASPAPGTVVPVAGPFDDRFTTTGLAVGDGVVTGRLQITSDVSDVLELQVLAGFYDARGRFLGTGRATYHLDETAEHAEHEGPPSELRDFRIEAPAEYAGRVAAAAVGVPVLVNE